MDYKFPEGFWWGSATSGPQCEGRLHKAHRNVFDYWYDTEPEAFHNQVGPNVASNFYNDYVSDIALIKKIGLNSFRTSIQWSRLMDNFEEGTVDEDAVRFYNGVIDELLKQGIEPIMTLHHFDLPVELYQKYGGWHNKKVGDLFVLFVEKCFELFGDRVKNWITFNEPMVVTEGQYMYQFHYPNLVDGKKACQVIFNINLASAKAVRAFRKSDCAKNGGRIGIVVNLTPAYPRSKENPADVEAARFAEEFKNGAFLEPAVNGRFTDYLVGKLKKDGVLWESTPEEMEIIKENTVDYLGVNFYLPFRAKARETEYEGETWLPEKYFEQYNMPGCRMNKHRGWEIYPQAIYDIAINIRDNYKNIPWYISENGMGVEGEEKYRNAEGMIADDYRIDFIREHLEWLHKGIVEGSNCIGYHSWTPIDCWSWKNAYKNRYGYIAVDDLITQKRSIKKSGYWIKEVAENNGF